MALPVLQTPEFETTIPSTGKTIYFRPFLVKEEKILLMALQGNEPSEMVHAVKRVLDSCVSSSEFDVDALAMFDLEYLFLQLRAKSVGEVIDLKLRHRQSDCDHATDVSINLEDVKVQFEHKDNHKIQINDNVGIVLKYPTINQSQVIDSRATFSSVLEFIAGCVDVVYDSERVYEDFSNDEVVQFLESLNAQQFASIRDFFSQMPKLSHVVEWQCEKCGEAESIKLEGLSNFFM